VAELRSALTKAVSEAKELHAPIGIGSHPDHQLTRDLALSVSETTGIPLMLYAEIPYAIAWGWPVWVSGDPPDPNLDPAGHWAKAIDRLPVDPDALEPTVVRLDESTMQRKRDALAPYESQLSMVAGGPNRRLDGWALSREVRWLVRFV
jgi:hypothetical protein